LSCYVTQLRNKNWCFVAEVVYTGAIEVLEEHFLAVFVNRFDRFDG